MRGRTPWGMWQVGLTLPELVITVAITAITLLVAVPSWVQMRDSVTLSGVVNGLVAELQLARTEAIRRGQRVVLCKASNDISCALHGGWEQGRLVFVDDNNSGQRDPGEMVIRYQMASARGWSIHGNTQVSRYVSYHPLGNTLTVNGAFQAGTFTICHLSARTTEGRQVIINSRGRPRAQSIPAAQCI